MKKPIAVVLIVIIVLVSIVVSSAGILIAVKNNQKVTLAIEVKSVSTKNYNNYYERLNSMDYQGNRFGYIEKNIFSSNLKIVDENNHTQTIKGVCEPFQLTEDQVFFIERGNLQATELASGITTTIAKHVWGFVVYDDVLFFGIDNAEYLTDLYSYNLVDKTQQLIATNIYEFVISGEYVFTVDSDDCLKKLSLEDSTTEELGIIPIEGHPYNIMVQGTNLLFSASNKMIRFNTETGLIDYIIMSEDEYPWCRTAYACDADTFYYSLQHFKNIEEIFSVDIDDPENGVWKVDLKTKTKTRISDEAYDELYLLENDQLIGKKDNTICELT